MDSDRKSGAYYQPPASPFSSTRSRPGDFAHGRQDSSAGYNPSSFLDAGRQEPLKGGRDEEELGSPEEPAFDIYADFNNTGPRYTQAFGTANSAGYRQIPTPGAEGKDNESSLGPVEMVTVPALGAEWSAEEMKNMTKAGRREPKAEKRRLQWKQFNRNERGLCGTGITRRVLVFVLFSLCVIVGLVLAFTIPRVPGFSFNSSSPLEAANGTFNSSIPTQFSSGPVNFTFPAFLDLELDTTSSFIPVHFKKMNAVVFDLETDMQVATGNLTPMSVPAHGFPHITLPLNFTYVATNLTDVTWTNWYDACRNAQLNVNGTRPGVSFRLDLTFDIAGLIGNKAATTQITDANCPIELPENAG